MNQLLPLTLVVRVYFQKLVDRCMLGWLLRIDIVMAARLLWLLHSGIQKICYGFIIESRISESIDNYLILS